MLTRTLRVVGEERTAPATWGQEYMWRICDVLGPGAADLNVVVRQRVPDGLSRDEVLAAVAALGGRHEALRTRFVGTAVGSITQVVDGQQLWPVTVLDTGELAAEAAMAELVLVVDGLFDPAAEPLVRVGVTERDGRPERLVLVTSHITLDGWSTALVEEQLGRLLAGDDTDGAGGWQPADQAIYEASPEGLKRGEAAMRYWTRTLARFPTTIAGDGDLVPESPRYHHGALCSPDAFEIAVRAGNTIDVSGPTMMLGSLAYVLNQASGTTQCPMLMRTNNRNRLQTRGIVCHFAQQAPVIIDTAPTDVKEYFTSVHLASMRAMQHGHYPTAELEDALEQLRRGRGVEVPLRLTVNYVQGTARSTPDRAPDSFWWVGTAEKEYIGAYCNVWESLRSISLYVDSSFIPSADVEGSLRQLVGLLRFVADGHTDLREFRAWWQGTPHA